LHKHDVDDVKAFVRFHHDGRAAALKEDPFRMRHDDPSAVCEDDGERPERRSTDDLLQILGSHFAPPF